jgi:hypothetical protein
MDEILLMEKLWTMFWKILIKKWYFMDIQPLNMDEI